MATPRKATPEEMEENKKKQRFLKSLGFPVNIDGSWGPNLEKLWQKALNVKLSGLSINSAAVAIPITAGAIASSGPLLPLALTATALAAPLTDSKVRSDLGLLYDMGKAYVGSTYNRLKSYLYPEEASNSAAQGESTTTASGATSAAPSGTTTVAPGTTTPSPQPERDDSNGQGRKPSLRERIGDRIAGRSSGQTTSNSSGSTPPNNNQNGSFLRRMLWETKNNNFGLNYWQWRNVGRVGLGLSYPAREHVWPEVGSFGKYMIMGPDSIPATPTPAATNTPSASVDDNYIAKDQYVAPTDTLDF